MAIDYSQYAGMSMPKVMQSFAFGAPPPGWDWGQFQAATGVNPNAVNTSGQNIDFSLWGGNDPWTGKPVGSSGAAPAPGTPIMKSGPLNTQSPPPAGTPPPASTPPPAGGNPLARGPNGPMMGTPPPGGASHPTFGTWPYPGYTPSTPNGAPFNPGDPNTFGTSSTNVIDPRLQNAFSFLLQQALARYNDPNGMQYYNGPMTPGLTTDGSMAQQLLRQFANSFGGINDATSAFYKSVLGQGANPGSNPALDNAVSTMRASANQQFTNPGGPLAQIRTAAGQAGQQGGTRQGIAEGVAAGQEATGLDNAEAQMRYQAVQDQVTNALRATGLLPQITAAGMAPGLALSGVDAQNREIQAGQNQDKFNAWAYNSTIPDVRLQNLLQMISGSMPLGGTSYSQSFYPGWYTAMLQSQGTQGASGTNNILGGVAGAAGLWQLYQSLFGH